MTRTHRNVLSALAVFATLIISGVAALAQQPPTSTTVYILEPDEEIVRPESTIAITADASDVVLILTKGGGENPPYYVFRNGQKAGPYIKFEDAMKTAYRRGRRPMAQPPTLRRATMTGPGSAALTVASSRSAASQRISSSAPTAGTPPSWSRGGSAWPR
jgi:hypothetical protein